MRTRDAIIASIAASVAMLWGAHLLLDHIWAVPTVPNCHGVEMTMGDRCRYSKLSGSRGVETYASKLSNEQFNREFWMWVASIGITALVWSVVYKLRGKAAE